jgi:Protein of unknown function (DUF1350)
MKRQFSKDALLLMLFPLSKAFTIIPNPRFSCDVSFSISRFSFLKSKYTDVDDDYDDNDAYYWDDSGEYLDWDVSTDDDENDKKSKSSGELDIQKLDWEEHENGSWVLLPPPSVEKPRAVIHFVGGTFFGSSPKLWYGSFLEAICRACTSVVVVTAVPVTLVDNPLDHVRLVRTIQRNFESAYLDIVYDEYYRNDPNSAQDTPTIALGHSLGSRLLAVLATLNPLRRQNSRFVIPPYQSYLLISFTNYPASVAIPGLRSLVQSRNQLNSPPRWSKDEKDRQEEDWDIDLELQEIIEDLQGTVLEQTTRVKDALTPQSEDLELYPTPDELWNALGTLNRYSIPETLLVQFDDDEVDQSARLATILTQNTTSASLSSVKFARLRGNHLTPIDVQSKRWLDLPTRATQKVLQLWNGDNAKSTSKDRQSSVADRHSLEETVASYIIHVIAKHQS